MISLPSSAAVSSGAASSAARPCRPRRSQNRAAWPEASRVIRLDTGWVEPFDDECDLAEHSYLTSLTRMALQAIADEGYAVPGFDFRSAKIESCELAPGEQAAQV